MKYRVLTDIDRERVRAVLFGRTHREVRRVFPGVSPSAVVALGAGLRAGLNARECVLRRLAQIDREKGVTP